MGKFRFESLDIWKISIEIGEELFEIANDVESKRLFRFAEQLRGAGLSMSNNIAEGSGSDKNGEFIQFLRYARRSCFENANMLIILQRRNLIEPQKKEKLLNRLEELSKKITNFSRSLK